MRAAVALMLCLVGCASAVAGAPWKPAEPGYEWSFPQDHWSHREYRIEWWYLTGHLTDLEDSAGRFGYQFTFFRIGLSRDPSPLESDWAASTLLMGHASITDQRSGDHRFSEVLHRESPFLAGFAEYPEPRIAWSRGPAGTDALWTLHWNGDGFDIAMADRGQGMALTLETRALKPRVFQGPGGFSRKSDGAGAASLYYSYTRLATAGTVELDGRTYEVRGESWMDKEFSTSQLQDGQVGWDWFSLQLDDGRELMLYELRDGSGSVDHARGTLVDAEGGASYLEQGQWTLRASSSWTSPDSGITYPSGWEIELEDEPAALIVVPEVVGQENLSRVPGGPSYWEGAVRVESSSGAVVGRGYVELTGYGENNRPPL